MAELVINATKSGSFVVLVEENGKDDKMQADSEPSEYGPVMKAVQDLEARLNSIDRHDGELLRGPQERRVAVRRISDASKRGLAPDTWSAAADPPAAKPGTCPHPLRTSRPRSSPRRPIPCQKQRASE